MNLLEQRDHATVMTPRVLDEGLPALPTRNLEGAFAPIARHVGEPFGAVLYAGHSELFGAPMVHLSLARREADRWIVNPSIHGAAWLDSMFDRPAIGAGEVIRLLSAKSTAPTWECFAVGGVAGSGLQYVTISGARGDRSWPLESPIGAFVACTDDPHDTVVISGDGGRVELDFASIVSIPGPRRGIVVSAPGRPVGQTPTQRSALGEASRTRRFGARTTTGSTEVVIGMLMPRTDVDRAALDPSEHHVEFAESDEAVSFRVIRDQPGRAAASIVGANFRLSLSAPLGGRRLVAVVPDLGEIEVLDGALLAQPTWLPEDWSATPSFEVGFGEGWMRAWMRASFGSGDPLRPQRSDISVAKLVEGPATMESMFDRPVEGGERDGIYRIRRHEFRLTRTVDVVWTMHGRACWLQTVGSFRAGDALEQTMRLARGLRRPGTDA